MTTLLLVRHGETDWNFERRWQGHADPPLNETGRLQSRALAEALSGRQVDAVYTSDLERARETAGIVAERLGLAVHVDARLREVDVGEWSGLTTDEIDARYPEGVRRRAAGGTGWVRGESYEALGVRVREALLAIAAAHPGGEVLVVTHGGPVRSVWLDTGGALREWRRAANCELVETAVEDGRMRWIHSTRGGLHQQVQG
jgi:2,3-bisphosphoglycerate-dependent phosphoglycerate mutase